MQYIQIYAAIGAACALLLALNLRHEARALWDWLHNGNDDPLFVQVLSAALVVAVAAIVAVIGWPAVVSHQVIERTRA